MYRQLSPTRPVSCHQPPSLALPLPSSFFPRDHHSNLPPKLTRARLPRSRRAGLISYSEATRYTPAKRLDAEAWTRQHARALGAHLLYPRTKGFVASVQALRDAPHVRAVYDVTIAYAERRRATGSDGVGGGAGQERWVFQRAPTFAQSVLEPRLEARWRFYVHVERFELRGLPAEAEELAAWLEGRWVEKGRRLEELRRQLERGEAWE
nr:lysocardiolipin acyltransferase 1 [Quercus suber]